GLEILSGAATAEERARLEHRLIGILPADATFSAGEYAKRAHAEIDEAIAHGRRPIVVGGTGLYLRAALADLDLRPAVDPAIRARLEQDLDRDGLPAMYARLDRALGEAEKPKGEAATRGGGTETRGGEAETRGGEAETRGAAAATRRGGPETRGGGAV